MQVAWVLSGAGGMQEQISSASHPDGQHWRGRQEQGTRPWHHPPFTSPERGGCVPPAQLPSSPVVQQARAPSSLLICLGFLHLTLATCSAPGPAVCAREIPRACVTCLRSFSSSVAQKSLKITPCSPKPRQAAQAQAGLGAEHTAAPSQPKAAASKRKASLGSGRGWAFTWRFLGVAALCRALEPRTQS